MGLTFSEQTLQTVRSLVPMDDVMFQKICEDSAVCQELISTILGEAVTVIEVVPQDSIMNLQGRSVRLDCLCRLSDGTYVLVEVQKADDDNHEERDTALNADVSDLMALFTDRESLDYDRFPAFSKRKDTFTNTEKGRVEMCDKVEAYVTSRLQQEL